MFLKIYVILFSQFDIHVDYMNKQKQIKSL